MLPRKIDVTVSGVTKVNTTIPDNVTVTGCIPNGMMTDYNKLRNLPTLNGEVIKGDKTSFDYKLAFVYEQAVAANVWEIAHNLNREPSVTVVDTANNVVVGYVTYIDKNNIVVTFNAAFKGKAYLN